MSARKSQEKHNLEDYEPGATKTAVFQALTKAANQKVESKRRAKRRGGPPAPSSS